MEACVCAHSSGGSRGWSIAFQFKANLNYIVESWRTNGREERKLLVQGGKEEKYGKKNVDD